MGGERKRPVHATGRATARPRHGPVPAGLALGLLVVLAGLLAVAAWRAPQLWVPAYLTAWLAAVAAPMGAAVLLLVHELTGGAWAERLAPALRTLAAAVPPLALLFLPLLPAAGLIYPGPEARHGAPDVIALYQNLPGFVARALAILLVWSVIARAALALSCRAGRRRKPLAGLLLIAYGVSVSFAAFDWIMGLEPEWHSTALSWSLATLQVVAALAACALARGPALADERRSDLAKLLFATLLGLGYLWFMQFLVIWSGNLPHKVAWFLPRVEGTWLWILVAALLIGLVAPLALLLTRKGRRDGRCLAAAGGLGLAGLLLLLAWQVLPAFEGGLFALLLSVLMTAALTIVLRFVAPLLAAERLWRSEVRQ